MNKTIFIVLAFLAAIIFAASTFFAVSEIWSISVPSPRTSKNVQVGSMRKLVLDTPYSTELIQGNDNTITLTGSDHEVQKIKIQEESAVVSITSPVLTSLALWKSPVTIVISVPQVEEIVVKGAGSLTLSNALHPTRAQLRVTGAGEIKGKDINTQSLNASISGAGSIALSGRADFCDYNVSGAGSIENKNLQCNTAQAEVTGAGSIRLASSTSLQAKISGLGDIEYVGNPQVKQDISGLGSIQRISQ